MRYNASDISGLATLSRRRTNDFQSPPPTPSQRSNGFFGRGLTQSSSVTDLHGMGNFPPQPQPNFHTVQQVKIFATSSIHNCLLLNTRCQSSGTNVEYKTAITINIDCHYLYAFTNINAPDTGLNS